MTTTPEQKKELRRKWVEALRSGKYKQNRASWQNIEDTAHCCLAVAGKLIYCPYANYDVVKEAFGLASCDLFINMNDLDRLTFDQIADKIESEPEKLFID